MPLPATSQQRNVAHQFTYHSQVIHRGVLDPTRQDCFPCVDLNSATVDITKVMRERERPAIHIHRWVSARDGRKSRQGRKNYSASSRIPRVVTM
jgi:hypothetical protein